jgi:hypothetical protein
VENNQKYCILLLLAWIYGCHGDCKFSLTAGEAERCCQAATVRTFTAAMGKAMEWSPECSAIRYGVSFIPPLPFLGIQAEICNFISFYMFSKAQHSLLLTK